MKKRKGYKHLLNYCANLIMILFEMMCFSYVWFVYYNPLMTNKFGERGHWGVIGLYVLLAFFFTQSLGGFHIGYLEASDIFSSQALAIIMSAVVEYFIVVLAVRSYVSVYPLVCMSVIEIIFSIIWTMLVRNLYQKLYPPRRMLVIYGNYPPDDLIAKINSRKDKYNICMSVSYKIGYVKLYTMAKEYEAVVLCDLPAEARNQIMKYCYQESIRTYVTPKISDILLSAADDIHLFDSPLLLLRNEGLTIDQRFFKRIEDIVFSLIGIIISSPIMLIIAICIKLYDGGPVFFKQPRYTRDNEVFMVLKFRSMSVHDADSKITKKDDARVTPVGKVIRAAHVDELPQLFNILKGEMSLVGPRPEWKTVVDKYVEVVPEFALRTKVKAGLTGYAQVYGKYSTTPYDKVRLDIKYIENYSLWLDLKLILLTVKILFKKDKTEGVDEYQSNALRNESADKDKKQV